MPTTTRAFIDTNILVYAHDGRDPAKRERSQELIGSLAASGTGVISTQVMQEFFSIATRRLKLAPYDAKAVLVALETLEIVCVTPALIYEAADGVMTLRHSFWDCLIVAAARAANCGVLYTEDMQHDQTIWSVRICNPFRAPRRG